jgi:LysR family transcriptional regulator, transcriptional activator of nhaA
MTPNALNYHHLLYFWAVAKEGSLRRASEVLHVICREGSLEELITQLAGHKLDVVPADEPSTSALRVRTFNQRLGTSAVVICAAPVLAKRLAKHFPRSLDGAPAILPVGEMALRPNRIVAKPSFTD